MFRDLYDAVSRLWWWRWPTTEGEITAIDIERVGNDRVRLAVAYKFSIGDDGPYTGESFWTPAFSIGQLKSVRNAKRVLHIGQRVPVRYRGDDPSVNALDGGVYRLSKHGIV
jgi:hypothetical protein